MSMKERAKKKMISKLETKWLGGCWHKLGSTVKWWSRPWSFHWDIEIRISGWAIEKEGQWYSGKVYIFERCLHWSTDWSQEVRWVLWFCRGKTELRNTSIYDKVGEESNRGENHVLKVSEGKLCYMQSMKYYSAIKKKWAIKPWKDMEER